MTIRATLTRTEPRFGFFGGFTRKAKSLVWTLPESWADVQADRVLPYLRLLYTREPETALTEIVWHSLPATVRVQISEQDLAAMVIRLRWMLPAPDDVQMPVRHFMHRGVTYFLPKPKGENLSCIEYPLADEFYSAYIENFNFDDLLRLTATLARPENSTPTQSLQRGDRRQPLHSRTEIEVRAEKLRTLPVEIQTAILYYFAGLKQRISNTYGHYLFDETPDDETEITPTAPNFGWWGVFQSVAEGGVFGRLDEVCQASLHEVCVYLVRKKLEADALKNFQPKKTTTDFE